MLDILLEHREVFEVSWRVVLHVLEHFFDHFHFSVQRENLNAQSFPEPQEVCKVVT